MNENNYNDLNNQINECNNRPDKDECLCKVLDCICKEGKQGPTGPKGATGPTGAASTAPRPI